MSGCVLTIDGTVVSWTCKQQTGVSLSIMEAGFIAASHAGRELLGLKELFGELDMKVVDPMPMWMDNQAAINLLKSKKSTSSAKMSTSVSSLSAATLKLRSCSQVLSSLITSSRIC